MSVLWQELLADAVFEYKVVECSRHVLQVDMFVGGFVVLVSVIT